MTAPVLEYHHADDQQFSLHHVTDDEDRHETRVRELEDRDSLDVQTVRESVEGADAYLIYTNDAPDEALPDFSDETELVHWLRDRFDDDDLQLILAVYRAYRGIVEERLDAGSGVELYKRMQLAEIPEVTERVQWRGPVPEVGAELLSAFILTHPMPNTNHRTGISLLDRYLTSIDEEFTMPDTGEESLWYPWVVDFIHDSKRLLTLRRKQGVFRYAADLGYRTVRRKEGITIDLSDVDLTRRNAFEYYTDRHLDRTRTFVDNLLEEADATHLRNERDDGKQTFVDRLRGAQ